MVMQLRGSEILVPKNILVYIPLDQYKELLGKCDSWRGEYDILKTGVVTRNSKGEDVMAIFCAETHVELLLDLASRIYPQAASCFRESIGVRREPQ